ncbi:MAG: hypothetical protein ACLSHC_10150 [Bilophila wadsworthia]
MYTDLKGKTAFVMGAGKARGIGFHIAGALARQGVSVCLAVGTGCVRTGAGTSRRGGGGRHGGRMPAAQVELCGMRSGACFRASIS